MKKIWRKRCCLCILIFSLLQGYLPVYGVSKEGSLIEAPSGVLMEASTGTILYEKDMNTKRSPASITKIMTLILIYDMLTKGTLKKEDLITVSAYAKSMGGSQVYLEEGETQTAEIMIKCIVIASGNDASVAMAEHIAGSEPEFVKHMNERAQSLGMKDTHFEDCCGLTESQNHYTTAHDIALMSRELVTKYPDILQYSSIWMDTIIHQTKQGTSEFGLTNTNKLIRSFDGCVGLKTGSTSIAKYCLSAVASRNDLTLISVVMAAPDYKIRFRDGAAMLNYGFASCTLYTDEKKEKIPAVPVRKGREDQVSLFYESKFQYLSTSGENLSDIKKKITLPQNTEAPVKKGTPGGKIQYFLNGKEIGSVKLLYEKDIAKMNYQDCCMQVLQKLFL